MLYIAKEGNEKFLYVFDKGEAYGALDGDIIALPGGNAKRCSLTNANAAIMRQLFPFTNPISHKGRSFTIGLGDRLGLASPGHLRLVKDMDVFPVLAQQSIRELNLTGRTYDDVLSAAVWAVFQEGYRKGYGADGDHLKTHAEVKMALDCGFTMITLDCSEHLRNDAAALGDTQIDSLYGSLDAAVTKPLESEYLGKTIKLDEGAEIAFLGTILKKIILVYLGAVQHIVSVYNELLRGRNVDLEVSVDETAFTTSPEAHYFISSELQKAGVEIVSLAPRFCGEFQKGIDYRGDVNEFAKEFVIHAKIAKKMGYKLSIHSGSDKFAVFPVIYKETDRVVHLKTAGTNWLEALRVIAVKKPELFRELHKFALNRLQEAKKHYHITENAAAIPDINTLCDSELSSLLDQNDARQVLHVTYGEMLLAKNPDGTAVYKDAIYEALNKYESDYYSALGSHINRHIL